MTKAIFFLTECTFNRLNNSQVVVNEGRRPRQINLKNACHLCLNLLNIGDHIVSTAHSHHGKHYHYTCAKKVNVI